MILPLRDSICLSVTQFLVDANRYAFRILVVQASIPAREPFRDVGMQNLILDATLM